MLATALAMVLVLAMVSVMATASEQNSVLFKSDILESLLDLITNIEAEKLRKKLDLQLSCSVTRLISFS